MDYCVAEVRCEPSVDEVHIIVMHFLCDTVQRQLEIGSDKPRGEYRISNQMCLALPKMTFQVAARKFEAVFELAICFSEGFRTKIAISSLKHH